MSKKTAPVVRTSAKQKLTEYKMEALAFIARLKNPTTQNAFVIATYEVVEGKKRPNALSAPEIGAIVGTARQLGKEVRVSLRDGGVLAFDYVEAAPSIPSALY